MLPEERIKTIQHHKNRLYSKAYKSKTEQKTKTDTRNIKILENTKIIKNINELKKIYCWEYSKAQKINLIKKWFNFY